MFMLHSCRTLPFFLYCCKRNIAETVCIIYHMLLKAAEQQHQHKNSKNAGFNQKIRYENSHRSATASNNAHGRNQEQKENGNRMTLKLRIWKF